MWGVCTHAVTPLISLLVGNRPHLEFFQHSLNGMIMAPQHFLTLLSCSDHSIFDTVLWLLFNSKFWPGCIILLLLIQTPFYFPPHRCTASPSPFNRNLLPYSDFSILLSMICCIMFFFTSHIPYPVLRIFSPPVFLYSPWKSENIFYPIDFYIPL